MKGYKNSFTYVHIEVPGFWGPQSDIVYEETPISLL